MEKKVTKKITKKVIFKAPSKKEDVASAQAQMKTETPTKRVCFFCKERSSPSYIDTQNLRKFLSDRGKILPKAKTGSCSKHQRRITHEIKYARHLSLLPFTPKV